MDQSSDSYSVREWISCLLYLVLLMVALLAPLAPFAMLFVVAWNRPDLWEMYWSHPWRNTLLLSLTLAAARVVFLWGLYLLSLVCSDATHASAYAWYPEMLAREYLADRGWDVSPGPDESWLRFYGIMFGLNLAFWLGGLSFLVVGKTLWRRES